MQLPLSERTRLKQQSHVVISLEKLTAIATYCRYKAYSPEKNPVAVVHAVMGLNTPMTRLYVVTRTRHAHPTMDGLALLPRALSLHTTLNHHMEIFGHYSTHFIFDHTVRSQLCLA